MVMYYKYLKYLTFIFIYIKAYFIGFDDLGSWMLLSRSAL